MNKLRCGVCKKYFTPKPYQKYNIKIRPSRQVYCSRDCYLKRTVDSITLQKQSESHKGKKLTIQQRQKQSDALRGRKKTDEHVKKVVEARKRTFDIRGRKVDPRKRERHYTKYKLWREDVFKRDNYKCKKCGERGKELRAHHIMNYAEYTELRFSLDNGITLCSSCHTKFHKKYGKRKNDWKQIYEYISGVVLCA